MRPQVPGPVSVLPALRWLSLSATTLLLSACTAVTQDVHRYYRQMEQNYKEAERKANFDALTLEGESRSLLQAGDFRKYNSTQRELARLRNWQAHCAGQSARFAKAAEKLEPPAVKQEGPEEKFESPTETPEPTSLAR
jgi:hypothetical protein